ncbi:MAG: hypothetical protein IJV19_05730 [Prevotella sp.]|nr:hypothetical protein [Prevotella sp.]
MVGSDLKQAPSCPFDFVSFSFVWWGCLPAWFFLLLSVGQLHSGFMFPRDLFVLVLLINLGTPPLGAFTFSLVPELPTLVHCPSAMQYWLLGFFILSRYNLVLLVELALCAALIDIVYASTALTPITYCRYRLPLSFLMRVVTHIFPLQR